MRIDVTRIHLLRGGAAARAMAVVCFTVMLVVTLLTIGTRASAQAIQADAKLQRYSIKIGEQTKLFFVVHQPKTEQVVFPSIKDTIQRGVLLLNNPKADTVVDPHDANQLIITKTYVVTSFDKGSYTIKPFRFVISGGALTTNELTLDVSTVKVDTTKAIYDIKQPLYVRYNFWDWLLDHPWVLGVAWFVIGLIVAAIWWYKHREKKEEVVVETPLQVIAFHTMILSKLQALRDRKLWQNNLVKEYYIEMTDILRDYIEKRYGIKTHEKTTEEIFDGLRYMDIAEENRNALRQVLVLADLVKFAKEKPSPAENEMSMDNAINFVKRTHLVPVLPTADGGGADGAA